MKPSLFILLSFFVFSTYAQKVGINTSQPQAKLDINNQENGLPSLYLMPQTAPVGSSDGEFAVIGDRLYLYSASKGKWLSAETSLYSFAEDGVAATRLEYTGDVELTGPKIPINGTIVEINIRAEVASPLKRIQLVINGTPVPNNDTNPNIDGTLALDANGEFFTNTYNLDINSGDILTVTQGGAGTLVNVFVDIVIKWRQ